MSVESAFVLFLVVLPLMLFWWSLLKQMTERLGIKGARKWIVMILVTANPMMALGVIVLALAVPPVHPAQKRADDLEKEVAALQQQVERNVKYIKAANLEINKLRRQVEVLGRNR